MVLTLELTRSLDLKEFLLSFSPSLVQLIVFAFKIKIIWYDCAVLIDAGCWFILRLLRTGYEY